MLLELSCSELFYTKFIYRISSTFPWIFLGTDEYRIAMLIRQYNARGRLKTICRCNRDR